MRETSPRDWASRRNSNSSRISVDLSMTSARSDFPPDFLAASEIPLLSRIIAVADAYNAMTSDRPYRDAMPSRVARVRLAQAVDSQFDTGVVAAFEAILASSADDYRCGIGRDFQWDPKGSVEANETEPVATYATT